MHASHGVDHIVGGLCPVSRETFITVPELRTTALDSTNGTPSYFAGLEARHSLMFRFVSHGGGRGLFHVRQACVAAVVLSELLEIWANSRWFV